MFCSIIFCVQYRLLNYFVCSVCFFELFWMFGVFCVIIFRVQCVLFKYFGYSVCFV